jgi:kynureninase
MSQELAHFEPTEAFARRMDSQDPLRKFREAFLFPVDARGEPVVYLAGNSLGLQPRKARGYIEQELDDWARLAVEGHLKAQHPWLPYHEELTGQLARLVGAQPSEVVAMNSLTVNLHLMMTSFYRPTGERFKILVEAGAFPSDQYAVASQAGLHGFTREQAIVEVAPRSGESTLRDDDLLEAIAREGPSLALVMLGNVNYLTGQAFDIAAVTRAAHAQGARVGFDLAHGAGNLLLNLHDAGPDFAVWCSYKYLNGGPGTVGGCFVHERHAQAHWLPRMEGWWGHDKASRFKMPRDFSALRGVEGWQLSNPPIFQLAALRASLELFDAATMPALRRKSELLTAYLASLIARMPPGFCQILTPEEPRRRGAQLSLRIHGSNPRRLVDELAKAGVVCDLREPDVIRAAPAPLYCGFHDVFRFSEALLGHARS